MGHIENKGTITSLENKIDRVVTQCQEHRNKIEKAWNLLLALALVGLIVTQKNKFIVSDDL